MKDLALYEEKCDACGGVRWADKPNPHTGVCIHCGEREILRPTGRYEYRVSVGAGGAGDVFDVGFDPIAEVIGRKFSAEEARKVAA